MVPLIPFANKSVVSTEITTKTGACATPFPTLMRYSSGPITDALRHMHLIPTPTTANKVASISTVADTLKTPNTDKIHKKAVVPETRKAIFAAVFAALAALSWSQMLGQYTPLQFLLVR